MLAAPSKSLRLWATGAGLGLFVPALGLPFGNLPLQPLDFLVVAGVPLLARNAAKIDARSGLVAGMALLSLTLGFAFAGGQALALAHGVVLAVPFVVLMSLVSRDATARRAFILSFLAGGFFSVVFFLLQLLLGAETLDFRSNTGFSLPPQYGRGFALFPEVSTFAVHAILTLGVALVLVLHSRTPLRVRNAALSILGLAVLALLFSRSTSFLLVAPILVVAAIAKTQKLSVAVFVRIILIGIGCSLLLYLLFMQFYVDRLESASASRSIQMRLASVLAGLSPLWRGELFGVGLGENQEIARRAYDISRALDLRFGQLPTGVNSQVVARIFEEGWPAVMQFSVAGFLLLRAFRLRSQDPFAVAMLILALGSFLSAGMVTGYRAIYTNWIWLGVPSGLLMLHMPVLRRTTPTVRNKITMSKARLARRA